MQATLGAGDRLISQITLLGRGVLMVQLSDEHPDHPSKVAHRHASSSLSPGLDLDDFDPAPSSLSVPLHASSLFSRLTRGALSFVTPASRTVWPSKNI